VKDVLDNYDSAEDTDKNKIQIIEWFQEHPGERFDISEVHQKLGDEMDIGRTRTGQILKDLDEENVLDSHGEQRKAYKLSENILIPARYRIITGLRHLYTIVDIKRWGVVGFLAQATAVWLLLTLPFWLISILLVFTPIDRFGPISQNEIVLSTIGMTGWLLFFIIIITILQKLRYLIK